MSEDAFTLPPDNLISEQVVLPDHHMALGLMHLEGAGVRVVIWDGARLRHMAQARARRWARELAEGEFGAAFAPVCDALNTLADRVGDIEAMVALQRVQKAHLEREEAAFRRDMEERALHALAAMPVEGRA